MSEEKLRLMTPLLQSRKIPTLSIVFQLIFQTTRMNYFYGCSCRLTRQISRKVNPTTSMQLEDYRQNYPQRFWSTEQVVGAQNLLLWWNTSETASVGARDLSMAFIAKKCNISRYHSGLKKGVVQSTPVPWPFCTHFTMRWSSRLCIYCNYY